MNNLIQNEADLEALKHEILSGSTRAAETNEGKNVSVKDRNMMLRIIVLLLVCIALVALADIVLWVSN